jgi:hypothetical protein
MATYYELVVKGKEETIKAFLVGFVLGRNTRAEVFFAKEHGFSAEHLKEIITHKDYLHVLCAAALRGPIASAISKAPEEFGFELLQQHRIQRVRFTFRFETVSREMARRLKRLFSTLPKGARMRRFEPKEMIDPEGKGLEGYAPLHDYRFSGEGEVEGDVPAVVRYANRLRENEFVEVEDLEIDVFP